MVPQTTELRERRPQAAANAKGLSASVEKDAEIMADPSKFVVPDLTIKEILGAIPAHCFERSAFKSSLYVVQDFIIIAALAYAASHIDALSAPATSPILAKAALPSAYVPYAAFALKWSLWAAYWFAQGLVGTGVWVIAHEAGHQAYSTSKAINNGVGWILHSALLVPYHSWRISHGRHHAATGHMTRDEVFVPKTRSQRGVAAIDGEPGDEAYDGTQSGMNVPQQEQIKVADILEDAPLATLIDVVLQQTFGWPMYLIRNASGQAYYPRFTNHFSPNSVIFDKRHFFQIIWSDIGIALTLGALYFWGQQRGFAEVVKYYFIPYLWVNHWLVCITFLQHTDPQLPHYREGTWNFQRGALCTIDRACLGWVGPYIFHGICETHVAHHISSKIPHYHAWEATEALKKLLGPHYHFSNDNMFVALYKSYRTCRFVEDNGDVVFYKDSRGRARREAVPRDASVSDSGVDVAA